MRIVSDARRFAVTIRIAIVTFCAVLWPFRTTANQLLAIRLDTRHGQRNCRLVLSFPCRRAASRRAFVTVLPSDEIVAIDLLTRKVTGRVRVGPTPDGLAVRFD
jgi:YVTN family beta-propeller protein